MELVFFQANKHVLGPVWIFRRLKKGTPEPLKLGKFCYSQNFPLGDPCSDVQAYLSGIPSARHQGQRKKQFRLTTCKKLLLLTQAPQTD